MCGCTTIAVEPGGTYDPGTASGPVPERKTKIFFLVDPWHTIHLGVGKTWVACGVMMLQALLPHSSMDDRVAFIGSEYKAFCKRNKLDAVIRKIDVHTFGTSTDPNGAWHKAAVTSNFMMFLQSYCEQNSEMLQGDERLKVFVS